MDLGGQYEYEKEQCWSLHCRHSYPYPGLCQSQTFRNLRSIMSVRCAGVMCEPGFRRQGLDQNYIVLVSDNYREMTRFTLVVYSYIVGMYIL